MRKNMNILLILLAALLFFPASVQAQQEVKFLEATVSIWPEYEYSTDQPNQPNVLVVTHLLLDPTVTFPAEITLQIPASAMKPHVVAIGPTPETVSDQNVKYSVTANGDWIDVHITATGAAIQLEYYDYNLVRKGATRQYDYTWPGDYAVGNLHFELREPLHSSNVFTEPVLTSVGIDPDGFLFSETLFPNVPAGKKLALKITYDRDTDAPSTSFLSVQSSAPLDGNISGQASLTAYLPWVLAGLGLVLIASAVIWYWVSSRSGRRPSRSRKRHATPEEEDGDEDGQRYCSQCGKRAQSNDRFCRACGSRLKRGDS
jgi:hypothetical protein